MKTITEFSGIFLNNAIRSADELTAAGKTAEELPVALGEALKVEGDRLKLLVHAVGVARGRARLKRVIVLTLGETEKAPSGAQKIEENHFLPEFYPAPPSAQGRDHRNDDQGRRGKGRDRKGRGRRGDRKGGGRFGDSDRGPRESGAQAAPGGTSESGAGSEGDPRRRPRRGRGGPRPDAATGSPSPAGDKPRITPRIKPLEKPAVIAAEVPAQVLPAEAGVPESKPDSQT